MVSREIYPTRWYLGVAERTDTKYLLLWETLVRSEMNARERRSCCRRANFHRNRPDLRRIICAPIIRRWNFRKRATGDSVSRPRWRREFTRCRWPSDIISTEDNARTNPLPGDSPRARHELFLTGSSYNVDYRFLASLTHPTEDGKYTTETKYRRSSSDMANEIVAEEFPRLYRKPPTGGIALYHISFSRAGVRRQNQFALDVEIPTKSTLRRAATFREFA